MIDEHPSAQAPETIASLATDPERFNAQREALRRYCYSFLRNESDAEDAVQLTLERALRYGTMHTDGGRWLLAIARNVCRDAVRARSTGELSLDDEVEGCSADLRVDPEHEVATRHVLASALGVLTPTERRAVGASWLLDQTSYDAARSVGIAHQTLRVHLARARKKLALYLDEAERATAGLLPWLLQLPQRGTRRLAHATGRDASWTDRLVAFSAPAIALAVTLASVAVVAHSARPAAPAARTGAGSAAASSALGERPTGALAVSAPASAPAGAGILSSVRSLLSPGREQDAYVNDVQPSPNYAQDHTLYASGTDTACRAQACGELFVSRDAGHTWTNVESAGLQPYAQLLLPAGSYANQTFYAFGKAGLQMTTNGGLSFTTLVQDLPGFAGLMPPGQSSYISVANVDLWNFATAPAPGLAGAYPPGVIAEGAALAVPDAAGWRMLQAVLPAAGGPEQLLVCGSGATCTAGAALPWTANQTNLVGSRDGSLVLALNANGLAVSRDAGRTFSTIRLPGTAYAVDGAVSGSKLLVIDGSGALWTSADFGASWLRSGVVAAHTMAHLVRLTPTGSLILELVKPGNPLVLATYECSADGGATWSRC